MRIPRIYDPKLVPELGSSLTLDDFGANHVAKVLRLKPGALIRVFDGHGHEFEATLTAVGKKTTVELTSELTRNVESPITLELLQVISRGDRMDFTIQKAVELGISRIVPLSSERCGVKLDPERAVKKIESFQNIAIAACEQCGRNVQPVVRPATSLESALRSTESDVRLLLAPNALLAKGETLGSNRLPRSAAVAVGPEGGFTPQEEETAQSLGWTSALLGPRVLRTETAGLAAAVWLQTIAGDFPRGIP